MTNKLIIEDQKDVADTLIRKLRAIDPYCILAGGAPRDWYFDKPASDLDIFVQVIGAGASRFVKQLKALGLETKSVGEKFENYKTNPNLVTVQEFNGFPVSVQIIAVLEPTFKLLDTFPVSISKAWYTPERGCNYHEDFKLSVKTKTIFLTGSTLYGLKQVYLDKILNKFKDYKFEHDRDFVINQLIKDYLKE